jgi:hypothetical protein
LGYGCGSNNSKGDNKTAIDTENLKDLSPCTANLFDGGGWILGIRPSLSADSMPSFLKIQFPPLLQNLTLTIDSLDFHCPDVHLLNSGIQVQNRKLIKFSTTLVFQKESIAQLFDNELRNRMNDITGQHKEVANYNVWQLKRDTDMWQLEARNLSETLGYPALEILMKRAESY